MIHVKHGLLATLVALSCSAQAAVQFNENLIANGGAEGGVSGWTAFDGYSLFQAVDYGGNWVLPTQPGPSDRGAKMFAGVGAQSAGYQSVDLGGLGDPGGKAIAYDLSGWLGGWLEQGDNALLYVSFLDGAGQEIGHAAIGPVLPADRGNATGLFHRHAEGILPTGTASLMFSLSMERLGGGDNDGYADNLRFTLHAAPVPEASMPAMALAGLGVMGWLARTRRKVRG